MTLINCKKCNKIIKNINNRKYCNECKLIITEKIRLLNKKRRKNYDDKYKKSLKGKLTIERWKNNPKRIELQKRFNKKRVERYNSDEFYKNKIKNRDRIIRKKFNNRINKKIIESRRREKLSKLTNQYTKEDWIKKVKKSKGICYICKNKIGIKNLTLDHIIPISKAKDGFVYTINDIQPVCKGCNSRKRDRCVLYWDIKGIYF